MGVLFAVLQAATLVLILAALYRPLGDWMARIYTSDRDWRIERGLYRLVGVDPRSEQSWPAYLRGVLAFSVIGVLFVYVLQRTPSSVSPRNQRDTDPEWFAEMSSKPGWHEERAWGVRTSPPKLRDIPAGNPDKCTCHASATWLWSAYFCTTARKFGPT